MLVKRRKAFSLLTILLLCILACNVFPDQIPTNTPRPTLTRPSKSQDFHSVTETPLPSSSTEIDQTQELPPLYLSIIIHTEEDVSEGSQTKPFIPDYDGNQVVMLHFSNTLRAFAEMAHQHGAKINFGSDWTFSKGVETFDPAFYTDLERLGHEIDAHAHESFVPYHQVRAHIIQAGGHPSTVASGMNERAIQEKLVYFTDQYPDFLILWGVSLPGHGAGECVASWVWRPAQENWEQHNPDGKFIFIGPGDQVNSLDSIAEAIQNRRLDRVNTYAVFLSPRSLKAAPDVEGIPETWTTKPTAFDYWENRLLWWDDFLSEIDGWVEEGKVAYATLTEIGQIFQESESGLNFEGNKCPRSEEGLLARNRAAGYRP